MHHHSLLRLISIALLTLGLVVSAGDLFVRFRRGEAAYVRHHAPMVGGLDLFLFSQMLREYTHDDAADFCGMAASLIIAISSFRIAHWQKQNREEALRKERQEPPRHE